MFIRLWNSNPSALNKSPFAMKYSDWDKEKPIEHSTFISKTQEHVTYTDAKLTRARAEINLFEN